MVVVGALKGARQLALVQMLQQRGKDLRLPQKALVAALGGLLRLVHAAFAHFRVREDQLQIDDVDVAQGVGAAFHVGDVAVVKAAHDMDDRIGRADVGKKLVAQTLALGRALDKAGDVDELNDGGGELFWVVQIAQPLQTLVRHLHDADIRVDGAESVVVRRDSGVGDGVEKGGFADVRQSDDT